MLIHLLSFSKRQHWIFRTADFIKIQWFILKTLFLLLNFIFLSNTTLCFWLVQGLLIALIVHSAFLLYPYLSLSWLRRSSKGSIHSNASTSILSVNVYQHNQNHKKLIDLVYQVKPDIVFTMESNKQWETSLQILEKDYPFYRKIPLENEYGIHFYSKLEILDFQTHFYTSPDLPSIEADLQTRNKEIFKFIGVHPSPPSPTQEDTSKERDSELLSISARVFTCNVPVLVAGDFNNVAWSRSSRLFKKNSGLLDAREGRGFISTFHAKYRLLRFPIDLLYHSPEVFITELKTLENIGSDHLPLFSKFYINTKEQSLAQKETDLNKVEEAEINDMIASGNQASNSRNS
jgi:endonuclease/exonuclease/phosphatase (EEP) superfamily protein YafD